ncbi:MAG: HDOD domain-containing protein [Candidatus Hydrogenedentota bacterium]
MPPVDIRRVVDRIQNLPTLPTVVMQIMKLVNNPSSNAQDVQVILHRDQSLTTTVMKLVNSSFYGYAGKITTLQQAVVILGFETIKSVALSATVFSAFSKTGRAEFDRSAFWQHSIATAVAARLLAHEAKLKLAEEAFVAGIIHDIGKVVMDEYAPELFDQVIAHAREHDTLLYEAERAVLGFSHAQLGRWLGTKWGLPYPLIDAIFYHHQPANAQKAPQLTALVHIGDILARTCKLGSGGDAKVPPLDPAAWSLVGISEQALRKILDRLPAEFQKADIYVQMARA